MIWRGVWVLLTAMNKVPNYEDACAWWYGDAVLRHLNGILICTHTCLTPFRVWNRHAKLA